VYSEVEDKVWGGQTQQTFGLLLDAMAAEDRCL